MIFWRLGERAAEDREVLGEHEDGAAVDGAPAGDDAVARDLLLLHPEIVRAVLHEHVEFLEQPGIEEKLDALARRELALGVLGGDARLAATAPRMAPPVIQQGENVLHGENLGQGCRGAGDLPQRGRTGGSHRAGRDGSAVAGGCTRCGRWSRRAQTRACRSARPPAGRRRRVEARIAASISAKSIR